MRPTTLQRFMEQCEAMHDLHCAEGEKCAGRDDHIHYAFLPSALADEVDRLTSLILRIRDVIDE